MQGEEDVVMVIDPAYIADQVTDFDGDEISVESITVRAPASATLTQQPDGMYHLVTTQDFNGLVELGYTATDGEEVVEGSLNVDVIPVNDVHSMWVMPLWQPTKMAHSPSTLAT